MSTLFSGSLLFLTNVLVLVAENSLLSDWTLSNDSLPYPFYRAFAVYDNVTNCIYGIGGTNTLNDGFIFNVSNGVSTTRNVTTSETLQNTVSQNAVLINNTWMYIINEEGLLFKYNIFSNNISLIDDVNNYLTTGSIKDCPIVSNNPKNTNFYICDGNNGNGGNNAACIEWDIVTQTGTQISSVCALYFFFFFLFLIFVAFAVVLILILHLYMR